MNLKKEAPQKRKSIRLLGHTGQVIRSLYLGLSMLLVLLLAFVVAKHKTDRLEEHTRQLLKLDNDLTDLLSTVQDAETGQRGYLLTDKDYYLTPFHQTRERANNIIAGMENYANIDLINLSRLDAMKLLISRKFSELERTIRLKEEENIARALALVDTDLGNELMKDIRLSIKSLQKECRGQSEKEEDSISAINKSILWIVGVAAVVLLLVFYQIYNSLQPLLDKVRLSYDELEAGKASLAAKNQELEHFAYIASHDLNEPLRTINSFVEILEEEHQDDFTEESQQYFTFINAATTRMRGLIDGLLSYSRLGKSSSFQPCDLNVLLAELRLDLNRLIEDKNALITVDSLPTIVCLKLEIRQLMQNLLTNALKFVATGKQPIVKISVRELPTHWEFCVSDNGIGIEPSQQSKIFGVYTRLHLPSKFSGQGIGLGLSQKIVEIHGGKIWVDSTPGEGSHFYFTIKKNLIDESEA